MHHDTIPPEAFDPAEDSMPEIPVDEAPAAAALRIPPEVVARIQHAQALVTIAERDLQVMVLTAERDYGVRFADVHVEQDGTVIPRAS